MCKFTLKSKELQCRDVFYYLLGVRFGSVFLMSWTGRTVTVEKVKIESTWPVLGSILYCGKPRRARQWKCWGLCKNETEEVNSCSWLQILVTYTFMFGSTSETLWEVRKGSVVLVSSMNWPLFRAEDLSSYCFALGLLLATQYRVAGRIMAY